VLLAGALLGCAPTADLKATRSSADGGGAAASLAQFSDIPIPKGTAMNLERSLIFGAADGWIGRLVFTNSLGSQEAFEFYGREMPAFGWQEITRVRAQTSVMTFIRGARAATIQITRTTLGGSEVNLTVSPQAQPATAGGTGAIAPVGPVTPLR
jgi:hypothetical protein